MSGLQSFLKVLKKSGTQYSMTCNKVTESKIKNKLSRLL